MIRAAMHHRCQVRMFSAWSVHARRTRQARDRGALGVRCCSPGQSVVEGDIDNLADLHQACIDKMHTWSNSRGQHAQPGHHSTCNS